MNVVFNGETRAAVRAPQGVIVKGRTAKEADTYVSGYWFEAAQRSGVLKFCCAVAVCA